MLVNNQHTRDFLARIKTITGVNVNDSWVYSYDDLGRLKTASNLGNNALSESYTYADNDNLMSRTRVGNYTYPGPTAVRPHAASMIGAKTLGYDANRETGHCRLG